MSGDEEAKAMERRLSAGHGVGDIHDITRRPPILCAVWPKEYRKRCASLPRLQRPMGFAV